MFPAGVTHIEEFRANIARLEQQRDEELGGRLTELEDGLKDAEKANIKSESQLKGEKDNKKQDEKKIAQLEKEMVTVRNLS